MLIELFGKNFGCFRDEFRLSMLATDIDRENDRGIIRVKIEGDDEPLELLRCAAIYGPNASGKSTVLRAASALQYLIAASGAFTSDQALRPYEPFALSGDSTEPVLLGVKAVVDGRVYEYSVAFSQTRFLSERLVHLAPERDVLLFDRHEQNVVAGEWGDDASFKIVASNFRHNALLLSLADSMAPSLAAGIAVGLRNRLIHRGTAQFLWPYYTPELAARRVNDDPEFGSWLVSHLTEADIGVVDVQAEPVPGRQRRIRDRATAPPDDSTDDQEPSYRLSLFHESEAGQVPIPYRRESMGTHRLVDLAPLLYDLLHKGAPMAAFIDELGASLHPELLLELVREFNAARPSNSICGQMVFAAHETRLMDSEARAAVLRRDQIYFTEKSKTGSAKLYSLSDFRERNNLNIRRRYLQGRYGALPALGNLLE